jgi:hypothetical protein
MAKQVVKAKITQQQFDGVQVGQAETSVRKALPAPLGRDFTADDEATKRDVPPGAECIYYRTDQSPESSGTPLFRFCFRDGKLADKRMVRLSK